MKENIDITVIDREGTEHQLVAPVDMGLNLMEYLKACEFPILATCGGMALCATCQIYIESEHELPEPSEDEELMLDQAVNYKPNSRLACQLTLDESLDGLKVVIAPE